MSIIPAIGATMAVAMLADRIQNHVNPANPAIKYPDQGQGTERRLQREREQAKRLAAADKERTKRLAKKPGVSDVDMIDETPSTTAVSALGQRLGTIKTAGDKFVLYSRAGQEVTERARIRDLKKPALALFEPEDEKPKQSRQVRRRLERKGW